MTSINRRNILTAAAAVSAAPLPSQARAAAPTLTPSVEEGPFYLPGAPNRFDIAADQAGVPIALKLTVLDETGAPLKDAIVDVWHCDATGRYSGFAGGPDQAFGPEADRPLQRVKNEAWFLRGVQATGEDGTVGFHTVYPGWYPGRTTHVHFKIGRRSVVLLTSQMFLPDGLSEFLYTQAKSYARDRPRDTLNRTDRIAIAAGERTSGAVSEGQDRYVVELTVVVDRAAHLAANRGGRGRFAGMGPPPAGGRRGPPPDGPPGSGPPGPGHPGFGPPGPGRPFGPPPSGPVLSADERLRLLLPGTPA